MLLAFAAGAVGSLAIFTLIGVLTGQFSHTRREIMDRIMRLESQRVAEDVVAKGDIAHAELLRTESLSSNEAVNAFLGRFGWASARAKTLEQAQWPLKVSEYALMLAIGFGVIATVVVFFTGFLPAGVLAGLAAVIVGEWYVKRRARKRIDLFNVQLPIALQMLATSLQSGFSIMDSIRTMARDMESPISDEFGRILDETRAGGSFEDSLERLSQRVGGTDLNIMIQALTVHRQIGGDLGEILGQVAETMREREQLRRDIMSETAQERMSASIVALLPVFVVGMFFFMQRDLVAPLWEEGFGQIMAGIAIVLEVAGFYLMRKVTEVEV